MLKKIIVTGGLGFIGSHFIDYCIGKNLFVINIDNQSIGSNKNNLKFLRKNYSYYKVNINNKYKIRKIINKYKPYAIVNFAAETHVDRSIVNPIDFINTNVVGLFNLAYEYKLFLDLNKKKKYKFIQISTDEVYGSTNKKSFKETDNLKPNSPYSSSKASAELILRSMKKTYDFKSIILRPSNNFGPRQFHEKLIPLAIKNLKNNQKIPIYGDGSNKREWLYVKDCVRIIYNIFNSEYNEGIFNIGSGEVISNKIMVRQLIKNYLKITNSKNIKSKNTKYFKFIKDRPGHDFMYKLDLSKIKETGFFLKSDFTNNLYETVNYFLNEK